MVYDYYMWISRLKSNPIPWLMESRSPSIRYYTYINILDRPDADPEVRDTKASIMKTEIVEKIFDGQHPDGYWGRRETFFEDRYGGTAWRLMLLAELGADPTDAHIKEAAEFLWDTAQDPVFGGFVSHLGAAEPTSCYTGRLLWSLIKMGYGFDPRTRRAIDWICDAIKYRDGEQKREGPRKVECFGPHSCIRGIVPNLRALVELPRASITEKAADTLKRGVEYILKHHVYKRSHDLSRVMNQKLTQLAFPNFYFDDFLDILLILTRIGCCDSRMEEAIAYLQKKQRKDGTWHMQRDENHKMIIPIEGKGEPSEWITLRALTVLKRHFSQGEGDEADGNV